MVANTTSQVNRTLPLLWREWQHAQSEAISPASSPAHLQMVKPAQPEAELHMGWIQPVAPILRPAAAEDLSQSIHSFDPEVSTTEEPDARNPPVRFCEGHLNANYGLNRVALLVSKERRNGENKSNLMEVV